MVFHILAPVEGEENEKLFQESGANLKMGLVFEKRRVESPI